jgi:hypothetical protein
MTAQEYLEAIQRLGLSKEQAAEFMDIAGRTSRNYATTGPPVVVAMLLRVMLAEGLSVDDVNLIMRRSERKRK